MNYSSANQLDNRVAIVTGGAGGIGFETAKALKECGAKVVIVDVNQAGGEKAASTLDVKFIKADLTQSAQVREIASQVKSAYGRIDIAFNNAGICTNVAGEDQTDEEWLRVINVNLNSVFYCCREFGRVMLAQGKGSIINTASMSGIVSNIPQPQSAYNTSKAGVIMLTKSLAGEWAKRGVRVNSISPGYIGTDITKRGMANAEWRQTWVQCTPMGRVGEVAEVASAVLFLASDASSYFTGSNLVLDGGYTCW
jgi:NAD(P)-dependent dehydrogenase (short-subunit alcohol dehydrogenase family)